MQTLHAVGNWLYWFLGIKGSGPFYGWWSAAGSDWGQITALGGIAVLLRHFNCSTHGCWRHGRFTVDGTPYRACHHHHPTVPKNRRDLTLKHIHETHRAAQERRAA